MIATIILGIVIFTLVVRIIYTRFIRHKNTDCEACHNVGCPLVDVQKVTKRDKI